MSGTESQQQGGQSHLQKQDLATLVSKILMRFQKFVAWLLFSETIHQFSWHSFNFLSARMFAKIKTTKTLPKVKRLCNEVGQYSTHAISMKIEKSANL